MPSRSSLRIARVLATCALVCTLAATPYSYVGVQVLGLVGVHRDVAGSQYGVGAGPLFQAHLGGTHFALHLEGLPVVSIPGVRPSATYGQATPALGIFNGDAEYALGNTGAWIGLGETIYNQRTPLPAQAQEVSSRLAGVRYVLHYRRVLGTRHFLEALVGTAPYLSGSDVYVYLDGAPNTIKPERASEVDASLEWGYAYRRSQWLIGIRTLNFSAMYPATGEAADRNVGIGPMIEYRLTLSP
jgi:hypothetical protein